jgi:hypothetical protein
MSGKQLRSIFGIALVSLLSVTACGPELANPVGAVPPPATEPAAGQVQSSDQSAAVAATPSPMTEQATSEPAAQPPGQSDPGAATSEAPPVEPAAQEEQVQPGETVVYTDEAYHFSISHPANFVLRTQTAEQLAELQPTPLALLRLMNPVTAASDLGDLEPVDLEVRIYASGGTTALEGWLRENGLLAEDSTTPLQPFQAANATGVEVCAATMIAPGCSYFVLSEAWVYGLTPATLEGEAMAASFRVLP